MFQRDFILRAVQMAAQAIARALGLIAQRKYDEASEQLSGGFGELGIDRELMLVLDAETLVRQLGDEEKVKAAVRLLLCDVELQIARGDRRAALRSLRAARALDERLTARDPELQDAIDRVELSLGG